MVIRNVLLSVYRLLHKKFIKVRYCRVDEARALVFDGPRRKNTTYFLCMYGPSKDPQMPIRILKYQIKLYDNHAQKF